MWVVVSVCVVHMCSVPLWECFASVCGACRGLCLPLCVIGVWCVDMRVCAQAYGHTQMNLCALESWCDGGRAQLCHGTILDWFLLNLQAGLKFLTWHVLSIIEKMKAVFKETIAIREFKETYVLKLTSFAEKAVGDSHGLQGKLSSQGMFWGPKMSLALVYNLRGIWGYFSYW